MVHKVRVQASAENTRKEAGIRHPITGTLVEIDIWIPSLNLYFEFQDGHHYTTTWYSSVSPDKFRIADALKRETVGKVGGTFIAIPCWWDGTTESLVSTIRFQRPDLLLNFDQIETFPVCFHPTPDFFSEDIIPGVGSLMIASFPDRSNIKFRESISTLSPWWLGEKYDGIRFCWNPMTEKLYLVIRYTRTGATVMLLNPFMKSFPESYLDGEIWLGRGGFVESQRILSVDYDSNFTNWDLLRFVVFDDPDPKLQLSKFEERYTSILINTDDNELRKLCIDYKYIAKRIEEIIKEGGEGVVLRRPASLYFQGISPDLLKLKAARGDSEALVLSVGDGFYLLKLPDGLTFDIKQSSVKLETGEKELKKGDVVSFTFDNFTKSSLPVSPNVYRIRTDISWKDVVSDYYKKNPQEKYLNEHSRLPLGHRSPELMDKRLRDYFIALAKRRNFDPWNAENWYNFDIHSLKNSKGINTVQGVEFAKSLKRAFPEIEILEDNFAFTPKNFFSDSKNRREFFDTYAKEKGLDPLDPETWYSITQEMIASHKDGGAVLRQHGGGYCKTLMTLYPDIGLKREKFVKFPQAHWQNEENRKDFFIEFARSKGFDALVADNWYSYTQSDIIPVKRSYSVLRYYNFSFISALTNLFPDIGLEVHKFSRFQQGHLDDKNNARGVFLRFAKSRAFDPFVPDNWYSISREDFIKSQKGAKTVLSKFGNNLGNALTQLFPEIGLNWKLYGQHKRNHWMHAHNQKEFFDNFATARGFDPLNPENWNHKNMKLLWSLKGTQSIAYLYNKNIGGALMRAYPNIGLEKKYANN